MPTLAGIQCHGSTWKKYLLHRLERADSDFSFCSLLSLSGFSGKIYKDLYGT